MKTDTLLVPITQLKIGPVSTTKREVLELTSPSDELFELAEQTAPGHVTPPVQAQEFKPDSPTVFRHPAAIPDGIVFALSRVDISQSPESEVPENTVKGSPDLAPSAGNNTPETTTKPSPQPEFPLGRGAEKPVPALVEQGLKADVNPPLAALRIPDAPVALPVQALPTTRPSQTNLQALDIREPAASVPIIQDLPSKNAQAAIPLDTVKPAHTPQAGTMAARPQVETNLSPLKSEIATATALGASKSDRPVQLNDITVKPAPNEPSAQPVPVTAPAIDNFLPGRAKSPLLPATAASAQPVQKTIDGPVLARSDQQTTQPATTPQTTATEKQTAAFVLPPSVKQTTGQPTFSVGATSQFVSESPARSTVEFAQNLFTQQQPKTNLPAAPVPQNITAIRPAQIPQPQLPEIVEPLATPDVAPLETQGNTSLAPTGQSAPIAQPPGLVMRALQTITQAALTLQDRPIELTLNPEELGRVRLTLSSAEGAMAVSITVERPETLDLLRRNIDILAQQLRDIGYQDLSFSFAGQGGEFAGDGGEKLDPQTPTVGDDAQPGQAAPSPIRINLDGTKSVDIRL